MSELPQAPSLDKVPAAAKPRRAGALVGAVAGGVAVLFAVLNSQSVKVDWLVSTTRTPLIVVIVISAAVGHASGQLLARRRRRSK
jgi:uncharacterized integral membrane protein